MRRIEIVLLLVGVLGLAAIVREVGASSVLESLWHIAWLIPLVLVFPGVVAQMVEALAWRFAFRRDVVPLRELFVVRLAGEALNMTTPTASIGGEGVKAWLLRDRARVRDVIPSLIAAKTSDALGQMLFLLLAVGFAATLPQLDPRMFHGMLLLLGVEAISVVGFVFFQISGAVARGIPLLGRLGLLRSSSAQHATRHVDRALAGYYRRYRERFALSSLCNLAACLLAVLETMILVTVLSGPAPFAQMLVVNSVASAITFVGFFVPGQVAVREGAYVAAFVALGLDPAIGLALGLAKRVLDLSWAGIGFVALTRYRRRAAHR